MTQEVTKYLKVPAATPLFPILLPADVCCAEEVFLSPGWVTRRPCVKVFLR